MTGRSDGRSDRVEYACKRHHIDTRGACSLERCGTGLNGSAGGDYVIDQQYPTIADSIFSSRHQFERARDIAAALRRRKPNLTAGATDAREGERVDGQGQMAPQFFRQQARLIEPSRQQAPTTERHGHHNIDVRGERSGSERQPTPEQPPAIVAVGILQGMNEITHCTTIARHGSGAIIGWGGGECGSRNGRLACVEWQGDAQSLANGRAYEFDATPTIWTDLVVLAKRFAASQANRWNKEIGRCPGGGAKLSE